MLNFAGIRQTGQVTPFFLPETLRAQVNLELKKNGYSFDSIGPRSIPKVFRYERLEQAGPHLWLTRNDTTFNRFVNAGHPGRTAGCILSKLDPDDLFSRCLQLFGPTMDPDYKKELERLRAEADAQAE